MGIGTASGASLTEMSGRSGRYDEGKTTPSSWDVSYKISALFQRKIDPIMGGSRNGSMKHILTAATALFLSACSGTPSLKDDTLGGPPLNLEEYFNGRVTAYGQFQDVTGKVRRRFDVDITGEWDGETLTLTEDFIYEDKSTEQRIWRLQKTSKDAWSGSADGVIGTATGTEKNDVFNWQYRIDLPVPDGTLRVRFDDWMWRLDDKRVLNRAYMYKFGVKIGEVIIFFEKT